MGDPKIPPLWRSIRSNLIERWSLYTIIVVPIIILLANTLPWMIPIIFFSLPVVWTVGSIWVSPNRTLAWDKFWRTKAGWSVKSGLSALGLMALVGEIMFSPKPRMFAPSSYGPGAYSEKCASINDAVRAANNSPHFQTNHIRAIDVTRFEEEDGLCSIWVTTNGGLKLFRYRLEEINGRSYISGTIIP